MTAHRLKCSHPFSAVHFVRTWLEVIDSSVFGLALLGTARLWGGIVPFTHLAREGCMTVSIGRRELLAALGSAAAWPLAARAQQGERERVRRIGILMVVGESGPQGHARLDPFVRRLTELGWTDGRNVRLDIRWAAGDAEPYRRYARELVALSPDVIVADASPSVSALQQASR